MASNEQPSTASSWFAGSLAAYQKAVDTATSRTKGLREFISEKQAALGIEDRLEEATKHLRETVETTVSTVTATVAQTAQRANVSASAGASTNAHDELVAEEVAKEMEAYGITDEFVEATRSKLDYAIFRDYSLPNSEGRAKDWLLNAWQERHVILLMQRVKEVDALRFALCPKNMGDGTFWSIYFELVRKMLPSEAYEYEENGELPPRYEDVVKEKEKIGNPNLQFIESRFREIGERLRSGVRSEGTEGPENKRDTASADQKGGNFGKVDVTMTAAAVTTAEPVLDDDDDEELGAYLRDVENNDDDVALDDDELDAFLDTLALSDDDDHDNDHDND